MSKIFNIRSFLSILAALALVVLVFILIRSCDRERLVNATVFPLDIALGESIQYVDNTSGARRWFWEFGNGDYSESSSGDYSFTEEGRYQVRLRVDNGLEKLFMVRVRPPQINQLPQLIRINAPTTAMQGEYILFSAEGDDLDWRWEFGESGIVDAREKTAIYAYQNHGTYEVKLRTEKTQYPVTHQIQVFPQYIEADSLDAATIAGNDIRQRLQNIVDGKPFNPNYNHILNTYLCGDPDVLVTVNNSKRNDFYSYCQGLRLIGRERTSIDMVYVESNQSRCINHIMVLQTEK